MIEGNVYGELYGMTMSSDGLGFFGLRPLKF